jgi:hypothetical protein
VELVPLASDPSHGAPQNQSSPAAPGLARFALLGNLVLFAGALVLALLAIGLHFFPDRFGSGLGKYDFTTPRAALVSQLEIQLHRDARAALELQALADGATLKEKRETLEIHKEVDWKGGVILFISYQQDGVKRYGTAGVVKNASTGFWTPVPVNLGEVREQNVELATQIEAWEKDGRL